MWGRGGGGAAPSLEQSQVAAIAVWEEFRFAIDDFLDINEVWVIAGVSCWGKLSKNTLEE